MVEQDIGKAAGRTADVHRRRARRVEAKVFDRMGQLDPAARDPGVITAPHIKRRIGRQTVAWLGELGFTAEHQPGQHQRLRTAAAFSQPAIDQQLVNARLGRFGGSGLGHGWQGLSLERPHSIVRG